ncbi:MULTISPECIES: acyl carrier protein [Chitinophagaceae]
MAIKKASSNTHSSDKKTTSPSKNGSKLYAAKPVKSKEAGAKSSISTKPTTPHKNTTKQDIKTVLSPTEEKQLNTSKTRQKAITPPTKKKVSSTKNTTTALNPMGNMTPGAFSKAAFEEQVSIAIRESISRQKDEHRIYDPAITGKMKSIIANYTESPELLEDIESNTDEHFVEKLNIDSVDFVEIIVDAEEAFRIKMEDEEIKALRSFDNLYDLIEGKIKANEYLNKQ